MSFVAAASGQHWHTEDQAAAIRSSRRIPLALHGPSRARLDMGQLSREQTALVTLAVLAGTFEKLILCFDSAHQARQEHRSRGASAVAGREDAVLSALAAIGTLSSWLMHQAAMLDALDGEALAWPLTRLAKVDLYLCLPAIVPVTSGKRADIVMDNDRGTQAVEVPSAAVGPLFEDSEVHSHGAWVEESRSRPDLLFFPESAYAAVAQAVVSELSPVPAASGTAVPAVRASFL